MKTLISIALVTVVVSSFSTTVVVAQDTDLLGVFFDEAGNQSAINTSGQAQVVPFYLVLLNPSHMEGIHSWECILEVRPGDEPVPIIGWELAGDAVNANAPPRFLVSLATPLPAADAVVLVTGEVFVAYPETEALFYLHPYDPPSLENPPGDGYPVTTPVYGYGGGNLQSLIWTTGCEAEPVARINDDGMDPDWGLDDLPAEIVFDAVQAGDTAWEHFYLENSGEVAVSGQIDISGSGFAYRYSGESWTDDQQWFRIEPGEDLLVGLRVESVMHEEYSGALDMTVCGEATTVILMKQAAYHSCSIDPPVIDFGEVNIYDPGPWTSSATITNDGLIDMELAFAEDCPDFSVDLGSDFLYPGESCPIWVTFEPSGLGPQECVISIHDGLCELVCAAELVDSPQCVITPPGWDFGTVFAGVPAQQTFEVRNTGGQLLEGQVVIPASCSGFAVVAGGEPFSLAHDETHYFTVEFDPVEWGPQLCSAFVSADCAAVELIAVGHVPPDCVITPPGWDFGEVAVGETARQSFEIRNHGGPLLEGQVTIPASCVDFMITDGGDSFALDHDETHLFTVDFKPFEEGSCSCSVSVSTDCDDIELVGSAVPPVESFHVEPELIDFGEVLAGYIGQHRYLTVNNQGTVTLVGDLRLEGAGTSPPEAFALDSAGPFTLAPGEERAFSVGFAPPDTGRYTAFVSLDLPGCSPVPLTGRGIHWQELGCWHYEDGDAEIIGSVDIPGQEVVVSGDRAVVLNGDLSVVDLTNPQIMGSLAAPGDHRSGLAVSGDYAFFIYLTYVWHHGYYPTLAVTNIADPANPSLVTVLNFGGVGYGTNPVMVVSGNYLYASMTYYGMGSPGPIFAVFDITNPENPVHVCSAWGGQTWGYDMAVSGDYAYVVGVSYDEYYDEWPTLSVIDIEDPCNPEVVGLTDDVPEVFESIDVGGYFVYVAGQDLGVYNVSDPASPIFVGSVELSSPGNDVALAGDFAYVGTPAGLLVFDISNPTSPLFSLSILGTMETPGSVRDIAFDDQYVYLAGGGALHVAWQQCDDLVAIKGELNGDDTDKDVPVADLRLAVHPNPFNPHTTVVFEIAREQDLTVAVYDLLGRRVRMLVEGHRTGGRHEVTWNGRDFQGRAMPSGAYVVRLETDSGVEARKVMLVR